MKGTKKAVTAKEQKKCAKPVAKKAAKKTTAKKAAKPVAKKCDACEPAIFDGVVYSAKGVNKTWEIAQIGTKFSIVENDSKSGDVCVLGVHARKRNARAFLLKKHPELVAQLGDLKFLVKTHL